jgi:HSP20 family molecular chaperone IbpA
MAVFQPFPRSDFTSLFRLLDDYDTHQSGKSGSSLRSFQPRFDAHEGADAYYLYGELPGLEPKDIDLSFTDQQTIVIKGRVERSYENAHGKAHQATVEVETDGATSHQVTKQDSNKRVQRAHGANPNFWLTERSVGEFHRSFSFPSNVDQDTVTASLKNGILNVVVPKAQPARAKRINIQ